MADPDYCEPTLAGWWAWGLSCSVAANFLANKGPWTAIKDEQGFDRLLQGEPKMGIVKGMPTIGRSGICCFEKEDAILYFEKLKKHFEKCRVLCGDWHRLMTPSTLTFFGRCAVLLDPPYSQTGAVYANDSSTVSHEVRAWCRANGDNPLLRIALCGHAGEHEELEALGWQVETWGKGGGYQGADDRERIWFSPHCLKSENPRQTTLF